MHRSNYRSQEYLHSKTDTTASIQSPLTPYLLSRLDREMNPRISCLAEAVLLGAYAST